MKYLFQSDHLKCDIFVARQIGLSRCNQIMLMVCNCLQNLSVETKTHTMPEKKLETQKVEIHWLRVLTFDERKEKS